MNSIASRSILDTTKSPDGARLLIDDELDETALDDALLEDELELSLDACCSDELDKPEETRLEPPLGDDALDALLADGVDDELPDPGRPEFDDALDPRLTPESLDDDEIDPVDRALDDELDDDSSGGGSDGGPSTSVSWHGSQSTGGQPFDCAAYGGYGG
jgi:hypothetical protein